MQNSTMTSALPSQTYLVGGCVRDGLLGLPIKDRDWVVVGATPEQMRAVGFTPVGADFPVFLHPQTHEEYALARTERKSGRGYQGFTVYAAPEVTLEEDLRRRDLTINAIAQAADGTLIDPYGGQRDLAAKMLRHVSESFAEDPLRVLRLARFSARFPQFTVAAETIALAKSLKPELALLTAERVWQELARGLMDRAPHRMLQTLVDTDAWGVILAEIPAAQISPLLRAFKQEFAEDGANSLESKFDDPLAAGEAPLAKRLKVPRECAELAAVSRYLYDLMLKFAELGPDAQLDCLVRGDAFRRPARFRDALAACVVWAKATGVYKAQSAPQVFAALASANQVNPAQVASQVPAAQIADAVRAARVAAIAAMQQFPKAYEQVENRKL
jgi:tRNA nucleotidyltransferase (CCA-adding enzyme)